MTNFSQQFLDETITITKALDTGPSKPWHRASQQYESARAAHLSSALAARQGTPAMLSTTSESCAASSAMRPPTTSPELTARTNDEGWESTFAAWLQVSQISAKDALLIFSVGGGNREKNVSANLVRAMELARDVNATVFGIVGRDGGYTKQVANACVVIPPLAAERVTPHTEGLCAVVWHLLVSHPALQVRATKWESVK